MVGRIHDPRFHDPYVVEATATGRLPSGTCGPPPCSQGCRRPDPQALDRGVGVVGADAVEVGGQAGAVDDGVGDVERLGGTGDDPRMLFSWYSADLCTDPEFAALEPELRANPPRTLSPRISFL